LLPLIGNTRWRPEVVICVVPTLFGLPGTIVLAKLCGARLWLHVQDLEVDAAFELGILRRSWLRSLVLRGEKWLLQRFDRISSISLPMVTRLVEKGVSPDRIRLVENWVNLDVVTPLGMPSVYRAELGLREGACVVLYSGNMAEKQGLEIVVEAARLLGARRDICFVLCGDGPARSTIEQLSAGLQNVRLLTLQPAERLNELLNLADIHVLPQRAEVADFVMPSKLTNMLASGRPVVATAALGTQVDTVVRQCGIVVPPGDVAAFAKAIASLADDPARRHAMGRAAREYAEANWARDEILSRFEADLLDITGSPNQ
jgi:colanic acid biosynthesis glycosyl transferase WcaI